MSTSSERPNSKAPCRGFTLMELLVVITIIAILVSLTLAAGTKVVSVGKERGTQWALQTLDTSLGEYIQANGSIPPPTVRDPLDSTMRMPIVDGFVVMNGGPRLMNSTAWYVYQLQAEGSSALAAVHQIDARLRKTGIVDTANAKSDESQTGTRTTQILDVWGNPIRYVHPRFGGTHGSTSSNPGKIADVLGGTALYRIADFFRDSKSKWMPDTDGKWRDSTPVELKANEGIGDSDGGAPPNRRPYFYSCGPDGDPATTEDNVYTVRPVFPR